MYDHTTDSSKWKFIIDDGFSAFEYVISGRGDISVYDIAKVLHKLLDSKEPLEPGKYVKNETAISH